MNKNKGFSLIELIIVVAIMAVLIAVIVPSFTKYVAKAKRTVDVNNAESFIRGARVVLINHELDGSRGGYYYSAVCWNKNNSFNRDNPQNLLDYFAIELGELPLSKAYPDYFWTLDYDMNNANPLKLSIGPTPGNRKYKLWPNPSNYLEGK